MAILKKLALGGLAVAAIVKATKAGKQTVKNRAEAAVETPKPRAKRKPARRAHHKRSKSRARHAQRT